MLRLFLLTSLIVCQSMGRSVREGRLSESSSREQKLSDENSREDPALFVPELKDVLNEMETFQNRMRSLFDEMKEMDNKLLRLREKAEAPPPPAEGEHEEIPEHAGGESREFPQMVLHPLQPEEKPTSAEREEARSKETEELGSKDMLVEIIAELEPHREPEPTESREASQEERLPELHEHEPEEPKEVSKEERERPPAPLTNLEINLIIPSSFIESRKGKGGQPEFAKVKLLQPEQLESHEGKEGEEDRQQQSTNVFEISLPETIHSVQIHPEEPKEEHRPAEERKPLEEGKPLEESKPLEERKPLEEAKPSEERKSEQEPTPQQPENVPEQPRREPAPKEPVGPTCDRAKKQQQPQVQRKQQQFVMPVNELRCPFGYQVAKEGGCAPAFGTGLYKYVWFGPPRFSVSYN